MMTKQTNRATMNINARVLDLQPTTYDAKSASVDAILSRGSPVLRPYGIEVLRISREAVDLRRVHSGKVPFLDSHNQSSANNIWGRISNAWTTTDEDGPALMGTIRFARTPAGVNAEQMVARGELTSLSIGYRVAPDAWEITDADGDHVDPKVDTMRWRDDDLQFEATRWELLEVSAVTVAADAAAGTRAVQNFDRALPRSFYEIAAVKQRMRSRQAMHERQNVHAIRVRMREREEVRQIKNRMMIRARIAARQRAHEQHACHV